MEITEKRLQENGWGKWSRASSQKQETWYEKQINPVISLEVYLPNMQVVLDFDGMGESELPNVTSMENLSLLEHLLSDNPALPTDGDDWHVLEVAGLGSEL